MRILHVTTGLSDGGAEAVLYRLCTASTDHRIIVISLMGEGKYGPRLREAGITVYTLGMPRGRITLSGLFLLWRLLRRERPDLVQTWMYHADLIGGLVAHFARIRVVCWGVHHTDLEPGHSKGSTILVARLCARLSHWIPRQIIYCAQRAATVHQALGYDANRSVVISNGYDISHFRLNRDAGQTVRQSLPPSVKSLPVIGFVARFDPLKDHVNLIAALERVQASSLQFKAFLVGTGIDTDNPILVDLVNTAGLSDSVYLLGRRDDIPAVMNALDLHVLSSAGEAFPNVLAEAMACGTPCVTTDVGDAARIVGDTGWVVPPRDPVALSEAIVEALREWQDASRWAARQTAARERIVSQFSLETMINAYEQAWQRCLVV